MTLISCGTTARVGIGSESGGEVIENGVASWYGPNFHGKLTANGEVYDMNGMTAAHRTLPFDSMVRVYNLDNDQSVTVRINDRGPFAKNRIIDLSRKAATEIGMIGPGTAPVKLYLIRGNLENSGVRNLKIATYTVQLGSYKDEKRAVRRAKEIKGSKVEKISLDDGTAAYRIYYGIYTNKTEAEEDCNELRSNGFEGYVKQLEN